MEVSNELILKAHKDACSDWKALIEKECPELFIKPLEGNRWLKDDNLPLWLVFYDFENKKHYGFNFDGEWFEVKGLLCFDDEENRYATNDEVQSALINEVKRLGFKNGTRYYDAVRPTAIETLKNFEGLQFYQNENFLTDGCGGAIFYKGKFAKIVEPSKKELLQQKLDEKISEAIINTYGEPKLIIMHPKTWFDLTNEVIGKSEIGILDYNLPMKYKGITVLRSLDVLKGEFKI